MCIFYEKGKGIIEKRFFETLMLLSNFNLSPSDLLELNAFEVVNFISHFVEKKHFEFYIYKLNIFNDNIKISLYDRLKVIEVNLLQIETLEEGDIISKKLLSFNRKLNILKVY